uniref:Uncharacterized protein n=1 Tax=Anguilla anguilla TaxID=7936 RepID=A0A0E9VDA2_ANGAN
MDIIWHRCRQRGVRLPSHFQHARCHRCSDVREALINAPNATSIITLFTAAVSMLNKMHSEVIIQGHW